MDWRISYNYSVPLIPIVKVTKTMPSNDSYIEWFDAELNQILKIVKQHA